MCCWDAAFPQNSDDPWKNSDRLVLEGVGLNTQNTECCRNVTCFTLINPEAVDHSGSNNFLCITITQNPLDLVSQST